MNIGRIVRGIGGLYYVAAYGSVYECSARGRFRKARVTPTVGDYVSFTVLDEENKKGALDTIEPRRNELIRPRVANIDCAVITFAAKSPDINRDLLDRFLILAQAQNIPKVIICINKCELVSEQEKEELRSVYEPYYKVMFTSTYEKIGVDELKAELKGCEAVLAGPSGVGKSSLINALVPDMQQQTGEISRKIARGKHTTRQVELLDAGDDTYIVDSPGFTSLSLDFIEPEMLQQLFIEFKPYIGKCYYNDCMHIHEPDCAVKEQIGSAIHKERYDRYAALYEELKQRR